MLEKSINQRGTVEIVNIDELVPKDHLLRKIDKAVDFTKIYELVESIISTGCPRCGKRQGMCS